MFAITVNVCYDERLKIEMRVRIYTFNCPDERNIRNNLNAHTVVRISYIFNCPDAFVLAGIRIHCNHSFGRS